MNLKVQSTIIASQTPIAPQPIQMPNTMLKRILNTTIEKMDINMQYFTSHAARMALGSVKAVGHINIAMPS